MRPSRLIAVFLTADVNALAAGLIAWNIVSSAEGDGWLAMVGAAAVSVELLTLLGMAWLLTPAHLGRRPWLRGVVLGLLIAVLAHPVAWYLFTLFAWITGVRSSLGEATLNPLEAVPASFLYAAFSLFLAGLLPFVLSAAVCGGAMWLWARFNARDALS